MKCVTHCDRVTTKLDIFFFSGMIKAYLEYISKIVDIKYSKYKLSFTDHKNNYKLCTKYNTVLLYTTK